MSEQLMNKLQRWDPHENSRSKTAHEGRGVLPGQRIAFQCSGFNASSHLFVGAGLSGPHVSGFGWKTAVLHVSLGSRTVTSSLRLSSHFLQYIPSQTRVFPLAGRRRIASFSHCPPPIAHRPAEADRSLLRRALRRYRAALAPATKLAHCVPGPQSRHRVAAAKLPPRHAESTRRRPPRSLRRTCHRPLKQAPETVGPKGMELEQGL